MRLVIARILWSFDLAEEPGLPRVEFDDWPMPSFVDKGPMQVTLRLRRLALEGERGGERGGEGVNRIEMTD